LKWIKSHHSAHSQKTNLLPQIASFESFLDAFLLDATSFYVFEPKKCMNIGYKTVCHFARILIITTKMMKIGENCNFGIF